MLAVVALTAATSAAEDAVRESSQPSTEEQRTAKTEKPRDDPPPRLKIDLERAIREAIAKDPTLALPHFEEKIEVRDVYNEALEALLRGADLECGATAAGPPTPGDMAPYRSTRIPPHADFIAAAKALAKGAQKLFGSREPRFFLYAIRQPPVTGGTPQATGPRRPAVDPVSFVLRDGRISENARSSVPGTSWELIGSFRDREPATTALRRLERGYATLQRAHEDGRMPPWVATTCRPGR